MFHFCFIIQAQNWHTNTHIHMHTIFLWLHRLRNDEQPNHNYMTNPNHYPPQLKFTITLNKIFIPILMDSFQWRLLFIYLFVVIEKEENGHHNDNIWMPHNIIWVYQKHAHTHPTSSNRGLLMPYSAPFYRPKAGRSLLTFFSSFFRCVLTFSDWDTEFL